MQKDVKRIFNGVHFDHNDRRIEEWMSMSKSRLLTLPKDRQAFILPAVESHERKKYGLARIRELDSDRPEPPISKKLVKFSVLVLGCAIFSAAARQIAIVTVGGALVVPLAVVGGIAGSFAAKQSIEYVIVAVQLKFSTELARRALERIKPSPETLKFDAHKAKVDLLEAVESVHDRLPKLPIFILAFLCAIEAASVFIVSLRFGLLAATVNALLPQALLWSIAYFYVRTFELPFKNRETIERYLSRISSDAPQEAKLFALIPDRHEYDALHINGHLVWIDTHDPHSPIKTDSMVKYKVDEAFCVKRHSEIDNEYCAVVEACQEEFLAQREALDRQPCPEEIANLPLPPHQIEQRFAQWYKTKLNRLEENRASRLEFIKERRRIAQEQCTQRIAKAREDFANAQNDFYGDGQIAS